MKYENLGDFANSLIELNYGLIAINLIITCLAIIAVYVHSRLKKSAELAEINSNFNTVLRQQEEITQQTENIKQRLNEESMGFQIKLSSYNEKSIESINSVYIKLIELRNSAKKMGFNPDDTQKKAFLKSVEEFRYEHDTKKIWIPIELSSHIEEVAIEIDNKCHDFIVANARIGNVLGMSDEQFTKISDAQDEFFDYVNKEIEPIFNALVTKISEVVNIKNSNR